MQNRIQLFLQEGIPCYKLLLLDYSMPDVIGPDLAMEFQIMLQSAGVPRPYICCCTAYSAPSFKRIALESGMDEFIMKPLDADTVLRLIND